MHVRAAAVGVARVTKRSGQRHQQMQQGKDKEKEAEKERDLEIEREQEELRGVLCALHAVARGMARALRSCHINKKAE